MLRYEEIYIIHRTIGKREFTLSGAKTRKTAADLAANVIEEEINSVYSAESKDYRQAWEVCVINNPIKPGTIKVLTLEEMAEVLEYGYIIQYVDVDEEVCKVWLSFLRVFE